MIPDLVAAYRGAIGKGYNPALDAVQMMEPLEEDASRVVSVLFM